MEIGFSIVSNKYIKASTCNYSDTTNNQIRCPFCFEPLFLKDGIHNKSHFSHYAGSINSDTCELRSTSFNYQVTNSELYTSKGQSLYKHYMLFSNCYALFMGIPNNINLENIINNKLHNLSLFLIDYVKYGNSEFQKDFYFGFFKISSYYFLIKCMLTNFSY